MEIIDDNDTPNMNINDLWTCPIDWENGNSRGGEEMHGNQGYGSGTNMMNWL